MEDPILITSGQETGISVPTQEGPADAAADALVRVPALAPVAVEPAAAKRIHIVKQLNSDDPKQSHRNCNIDFSCITTRFLYSR